MTPSDPSTTPESVTESLQRIGIDGAGAAGEAWRSELRTNTNISQHLSEILAAVKSAKERAEVNLANYKTAAPSPAEIEAAQQEVFAASRDDDARHADRLKHAEERLGELLARKEAATDQYESDSKDNIDDLDADRHAADQTLSPEARAKLQQMLAELAAIPQQMTPQQPQSAPQPAAAGYPSAAAPAGSDIADSGFNPDSAYDDTAADQPAQTHTAGDTMPFTAAPTLTNVTTAAPIDVAGTPIATSAGQPTEGPSAPTTGASGLMPPMTPGMGAGAGAHSARREASPAKDGKSVDRDEILNGDDMLSRSVNGRL